jgi:hypothetical protein
MKKIIFYILAFLLCLPTQAQQRFFGVIQEAALEYLDKYEE